MSATVTLKTLNKSYIFDTITNSITHKKLVFAPSQYLFHQEKNVDGLLFVKSGIVKNIRELGKKKESILGLSKSGEFLGQQFLIGEKVYSSSAKALGNVEVQFYKKDDIQNLLNNNQNLRLQVLLLLCNDVEDKESKIAEKAFKNLREIVADTLMLLYEEYGSKKYLTIDIGITLTDLASLAGISVSYLRKVLLSFEQHQLIQILNKKSVSDEPLKIKILNKSGLKNQAIINLKY